MQLLKIRFYQIKRDLSFLFFAIVGLCAGLSYFFFDNPKNQGLYFTGVVLFLLFNFHSSRKDLNFIFKNLVNPFWQLVLEYQVFMLILSLSSLFTSNWYCFFILQTGALLTASIKLKSLQKPVFKSISKYIPAKQFEWVSGIRRNFVVLLVLVLLAVVLSPVKLFGLAALFLINNVFFSFYTDCEPRNMLLASGYTPKEILHQKIFFSVKTIALINLPLLIVNSIFNPDFLMIHAGFLLYMCLLALLAVSIKYNTYIPNTKSTAASLQIAFTAIAIMFPQFAIITVLLCIKNYTGAIKQLTYYIK